MAILFNGSEGMYLSGAMYIQIDMIIDFKNFESEPKEKKGTFIHEYCHFLQEVSTVYGYINFSLYLQRFLCKIKKFGNQNEQKQLDIQECLNRFYRGDTYAEGSIDFINSIDIIPENHFSELNGKVNELVKVTYNGSRTFQFGSLCIAESMAYLTERRMYDVKERMYQFPYNACEQICKHEYAELAQNDLWILAVCELSLMVHNSGSFFVKIIRLMREKRFLPSSVIEIEKFANEHFELELKKTDEIESCLAEIYPDFLDDFSLIKKWIMTRFEWGRIYRKKNKCFISLALSNDNMFDIWNKLMLDFGCPVIIDKNGTIFEGGYLGNRDIDLRVLLAPMAINELLNYKGEYVCKNCPLEMACEIGNYSCFLDKCSSNLNQKDSSDVSCPVESFWRAYGLGNKIHF